MRTITILDREKSGSLSVDLQDILVPIAPVVRRMNWKVRDVDCTGDRADELQDLSLRDHLIGGDDLLTIAGGLQQVVDGHFFGYEQGSVSPSLVLRAVDSSSWDVASDDEDVLNVLRRRFNQVFEAGDLPV